MMANEPTIMLRGNIGRTPEKSDRAEVVNFTLAVTPRVKKGDNWVDGEVQWYECAAWGALGDNMIEEGYAKGDAVLIVGAVMGTRSWESNGRSGVTVKLRVEQLGKWTPTWATTGTRKPEPEQGWYEPRASDEVPF